MIEEGVSSMALKGASALFGDDLGFASLGELGLQYMNT